MRPFTDVEHVLRRVRHLTRADFLEPRDPVAARRLVRLLTWGSVVATAGFTLLALVLDGRSSPAWWFLVPIAILPIAFLLQRATPSAGSPVWLGLPLLAVAVITGLNLATHDASAAAQTFYFFPVLFAASNLKASGAGVVALATLAGDAVVVFTVLPVSQAITDFAYVGLTVGVMNSVLVRAGVRNDRLIARLRELATIDPLTGLATRRVFSERARSALARRPVGDGTALIVLDIDLFKEINDTYGHAIGDDVLVHVARLLADRTRVDSVVSRIGGDEVAVLLPRCTAEAARERADEFVQAVREHPFVVSGLDTPIPLTVSVGVAHSPADGSGLRELYEAADEALYRAKRAGRDQVGLASSYALT